MKIEYKFADGTTTEIEVDKQYGEVILCSRRKEANGNRKERGHCISIDDGISKGFQYSNNYSLDNECFRELTLEEKLPYAISQLTEYEKDLILSIYFNGKTRHEIALNENVSDRAVGKKLKRIEKKLKKFL